MSDTPRRDDSTLDDLCINTIRCLSIDAIQKANSGHPGAPMGLAPASYVLWTRILKHNPNNPGWIDRDRFVLSGGHASMLLYSLLHLTGYPLSLDDIRNFRQLGSKTPGHPEYGHTPGVETTTGPLGQGFANAVGMAIAEQHLANRFNRDDLDIVNHFTYVMCGDGDLMEGISYEAASLAGHLGLGKLICMYDDNEISIEGNTDITFTEDVPARFKACGWQVLPVTDGTDIAEIYRALRTAQNDPNRPSLIILQTHIAHGSPNKQDTADAHGAPLGEEEVALTKKNLGFPEDQQFYIPEEALDHFRKCSATGVAVEEEWLNKYRQYADKFPDLANQWVNALTQFLPAEWDAGLPAFTPEDGPIATRAASGKVLNKAAQIVTTLMGGSADLAPSNKTLLECCGEFQRGCCGERNIRFGVREHAMTAVMSGMYLHGGLRPYGGTFLIFSDYMRPAIRVASLMKLPVIYVFTHDSVAVGEDGPTHQPVEQLASLRAIPGLTVLRPADANETADAWRHAIKATSGPVALALSRQKLPVLEPGLTTGKLESGAYVLEDCGGTPDIIIIATGAEVHLAVEAKQQLAEKNISARVVSMPSWELFEKTSDGYKNSVLLPGVPRIAVEAASPMGWERYTLRSDAIIGIDRFGTSAPGGEVLKTYGFQVDGVVNKAEAVLNK
ncbi:MAG: transketolase [Thermodesulfobacteriota bacterium]|nr:transketolase [Thermodesulfobacteriota bacterium]